MPSVSSVEGDFKTSIDMADAPIAYIMKRYPRLTETFILNEIRAMERLGGRLHIVSLLPPEPPPHHPMVAEVEAPVHALSDVRRERWGELARAHAKTFIASPMRYAGAFARACLWSALAPTPFSVWKQFARGGFIATLCRRHGIRHIHAHFANAPAASARFASLMSGIPFSFTAHAKDLYLTPKRVIQRRGRAARFIVTCTGYNARYLESLLGDQAEKIHVVYHGIDLGLFGARRLDAMAPGDPPLILSVGRLVPKKGHDDLIAACAALRAKGVDFRCRIIGEGPLRGDLAAQIAAVGLDGIVSLDGAMTHAKLIALYRTADLFALAPRITDDGDRDGIPNVIAEAMAIGVPVVSTSISGIPELVRHDETGLLVPPREPVALAAAMDSLLNDRELAGRLASAGRARLEGEFDLWTTTRRLHGLFGCAACDPAEAARPASAKSRLHADVPAMVGADR